MSRAKPVKCIASEEVRRRECAATCFGGEIDIGLGEAPRAARALEGPACPGHSDEAEHAGGRDELGSDVGHREPGRIGITASGPGDGI